MSKAKRKNSARVPHRCATNDKRGARNEHEGAQNADRRYREGVAQHVESGRSEGAADEARRALEGDEADELERAEQEGRRRADAHPNDDLPINPDPD
jgi:hypothetical protein